MGADFVVGMEVRPVGAVRGTRELASATKELTQETARSGEASRRTATASEELQRAERRRMSAAAEMVRSAKAQIAALAEYQKQILAVASTEAARAAVLSRTQSATVATTGVDPSSRLGTAMTALLERERQLRASIQDTAEELSRADNVAGNIAGLQARTRAMEGSLAAARRGEEAERAYAAALEVRKAVEASGARPGTDQAAAVEREVKAQQRLQAELQAVAAARERERRAAEAANAQRDRVAGEISRLRETTHQLEILASAHLRGRNAVREANVQLEVRNALLRQGVAAGSADAVVIEQQIRRQAQLRQQLDQVEGAKRRTAEGVNVLRNAFFALQGAIAALGLSALIRDSVQTALALDRAQKSFVAAAGSTAGAAREMAFVTAEADRLGLVLVDTAQGYASLANAAKGTVLQGQAARDIFSAVSEAATVLGLSADQTRGALLGVQQTISKGKVTAEELVQQISERLPGAYQAMATSLGISTRELAKRLEQGKVGLKDLVGWAEEMRKRFSAGLLTAVNSDQANINRLRNMIDQVKAEAGSGFLSGFLSGFSDLKKELSSDELRLQARNLGESIGGALRTAADGAAFLAKNLELVKIALIAILALRAAAFFVTLATAIAEATGRTIAFKAASSNLALAGGLGAVAIALGALILVMNQYIAASRLAWETEMDRVARSQEVFNYYNTLKENKVGLTEAEAAYALEVRKTMEAERAALAVSLARTRAQLEASKTLNPFKYQQVAGPGRNALKEQVAEQERELKTIDNQLNILDQQWSRLAKLPTIKLPVDAGEVDKTAKKVADLLENFRRAAEQAERIAVANRSGAAEARRVTDAIERENAAYQALNSLENLSVEAKRKLSAIIGGLVSRTQAATLASEQSIATRERDLAYTDSAREAEARLADAKAGGTEASRLLAAALEAETEARRQNREEDVAFLKQLTEETIVRKEYLRSTEAEIAAGTRAREWANELAGLHAQLADAQTRTANATQAHAVALEAERLQIADGVPAWEPRGQQLRQEAELRAFLRALTLSQVNAQIRLNEAQDRQNAANADFADWRQQSDAARRYGSELTDILSQYGLLSDATKELAIQEEIRQRVLADGTAADRDAIEAAVRGEQARIDAIQQAWANAEIQAWVAEPFFQAWDTIQAQFIDTLNEMILTGKADWESLWKSFLQQALQAIEQWLLRWIAAHRLAQAEAARTAAVNAAAGSATAAGGGGVTGGLTTIGLTGASTAAGSSSLGASFSTWGTYASYAFLAWVGYKIFEGWTKARVSFGEASIGGGQSGSRKIADQMRAVIQELVKQVEEVAKQWDLGVISLKNSSITIGRTSRGLYYVKGDFLGNVGQGFKTIEEAMDFARVAALRTADFAATTSRLVVAIIRNTRAQTTAQLQAEVEIGRRIDSFAPDQTARAVREWEEELDTLRTRIIELIPRSAELATALANISAEEIRRWQNLRDQITGRQRTEAEELADRQARAQQFNAEKALRIADLKLRAVELQIQIDQLRARGDIVRGGGISRRQEIEIEVSYLNAKGTILKAEVSLYQQHLAALEGQLAAINLVITGLEAIPDIDLGDITKPRAGRGGGRSDRADTRQAILREAAQFGRGQVDATFAAAQQNLRDFVDRVKEAGIKGAEAARLIGLAEAELSRQRAEIVRGVMEQRAAFVNRGTALGGQLSTSLDEIDRTAQGLIADTRALGRAGAITTAEMRRLNTELRNVARAQQVNATQAFGNQLLGDLYNLLGLEKEAAQLKYDLAIAELTIRREELAIAVKRLGLDESLLDKIDELINKVKAAGVSLFLPPTTEPPPPPPPGDPYWWVKYKTVFPGYTDSPPPTTATGPSGPTVLQEAARKFAEAVDTYVRATEDLLVNPDLSILSPDEQMARLRDEFYKTLEAAKGGDAEAASRLGDVQQQLLEAAKRAYGGGVDALGNAGYISLFQELVAAGQGLVTSTKAQESFALAATIEAAGEQNHRDLQTLIDLMQGIRDASGGAVLYAPGAFGGTAVPAGSGSTPVVSTPYIPTTPSAGDLALLEHSSVAYASIPRALRYAMAAVSAVEALPEELPSVGALPDSPSSAVAGAALYSATAPRRGDPGQPSNKDVVDAVERLRSDLARYHREDGERDKASPSGTGYGAIRDESFRRFRGYNG